MLRPALLLLVLSFSTAALADTRTVTVGDGQLQGAVEDGAAVFRDIPYAAPPVGDLRWRPPQPPSKWLGARDATRFGPACPQAPNSPVMMVAPVGASSEDCLTLNVSRPADAAPDAKLPVMVWIHGGGFFTGSGSEQQFDDAPYVARGIVFVTINYRLGRLGFFAHPALDAEHPAELHGNYGLMDQIAALDWVKANIAAFGGDSGNVTVFGESAGGISILALMAATPARGLFQKAIVESGTFPNPMRDIAVDQSGGPSAESLGTAFAVSRGISGPDAAKALRALPLEKIAPSTPVGRDELANIQAMSAPMIDGKLLTENVYTTFARRGQAKIPLLIGSNSLEAFVWLFLPNGKVTAIPLLPTAASAVTGPLGNDKDAVLKAYAARFGGDMEKAVATVVTDMTVGAGARLVADSASALAQPTYLYRFETAPSALRAVTFGAPHGAEIPFVFGVLGKLRNVGPQATDADRALSAAIIDYWASFAKNADPNGPGRVKWPPYGPKAHAYLAITDKGPVPHSGPVDSFQALFTQRLTDQFANQPHTP